MCEARDFDELQMFWTSIIKQLAGRNVALRHSLASLGSIHELDSQRSTIRNQELSVLAYEQYYKAVRRLEATYSTRDTRLIRVVCFILFITIELKLGAFERAQSLLTTSLKMLDPSKADEEVPETSTEEHIAREYILPMLMRFRLQVSLPTETSIEHLNPQWYVPPELPNFNDASFSTIDCARETLGSILRSTFSAIHLYAGNAETIPLERTIETGRLILGEWKTRFHLLCTLKKPTSNREIVLLQIQCRAAELVLRTVVSTRDLPEIEAFAEQVEACEEFLTLHLEFQRSESIFFMDYALIPALFFSATRCPDTEISERALRLLKATRWQEGFWSSQRAAEEAERVLASRRSPGGSSSSLGDKEIYRARGIVPLNRFEGCAWEFLSGHGLVLSKLVA